MNMIYSNKEITVSVGKLKGIMNNVKYDFFSCTINLKSCFRLMERFIPLVHL